MHIYIIGTKDKQKIGISGDVSKRLSTLQTGNPDSLKIHYTIELPKDRARLVEKKIHKEYNHLKIKGEWFNMIPTQAANILDFALIRWAEDILI
jgi:hypothetical protein